MVITSASFDSIAVVGLGYIGLPTAATIASRNVDVLGVDVNQAVVDKLNQGFAHFSEPDLDALLADAVASKKLCAAIEPAQADAFIIAVPTPFLSDKTADLKYVEAATRAIARVLKSGDLVILESTSPVGTTAKICGWIEDERPDLVAPTEDKCGDFHAAYCPERILPGQMVAELVQNDRILGGVNAACAARAAELYSLFVEGTLYQTRAPVAEAVKLVENAYRDVNIAFANELSVMCKDLGIDPFETIALANRHPRVNILNPGPGVGGHCIAVDPWFLISAHPGKSRLMESARIVNDGMPAFWLDQLRERLNGQERLKVACLGLAYKPDVDDLRESPAIQIVDQLAGENAELAVVEPHIDALPSALGSQKNVTLSDLDTALADADIVLLLVGHTAFKAVTAAALADKLVFDTVGLWRR